jgi:D-alanine-D-alanine ligase
MTELNAFKEKKLSKFEKIFFNEGSVYALNAKKGKIKKLAKIDVAINCCHGGLGEGGGVSAMLQMQGIPLASPTLAPSAICMDKALTKQFAKSLNIPVVEGIRVREEDYKKRGAFLLRHMVRRLKFPVIVKPVHLGSSIGIAVCKDEEEVKAALAAAYELDDCVVIEKFLLDKKDVNCAVYSTSGEIYVSEAEEAFSSHDGVYGFEQKYVKKEQKSGGRALMTGMLRQRIRGYTKTLYKRLNMTGVVRMDFLVQGEKVYLSEINTVPGSLAYYLFCDRITEAKCFFEGLIDDAIARAGKDKKRLVKTGILDAIVK